MQVRIMSANHRKGLNTPFFVSRESRRRERERFILFESRVMQPLPVAIDIGNSFYPLSVTPATCLTEYLPHQSPANCLLAHALDPRKILYTLFSEQNNGVNLIIIINLTVRFFKSIQYHLL